MIIIVINFIDIEGGKVVIRLVINMKWCKMIDMFDIDNVIQILGFVDKINWGLIVKSFVFDNYDLQKLFYLIEQINKDEIRFKIG